MADKTVIISLQTLIELMEDSELENLLSSFCCEKDEDINYFLKEKAIKFEKLSKSRTYLVFSRDDVENKDLSNIKILGYISLALKVLSVSSEISNNLRKDIDGLSSKIHGEIINDFPCYLIGQLARDSKVSRQTLSGKQLLEYSFDIIASSVKNVGGRYTLIECKNNNKLIDFYSNNNFRVITSNPKDNELIQMLRKVA